jgi:hypothetical protein
LLLNSLCLSNIEGLITFNCDFLATKWYGQLLEIFLSFSQIILVLFIISTAY